MKKIIKKFIASVLITVFVLSTLTFGGCDLQSTVDDLKSSIQEILGVQNDAEVPLEPETPTVQTPVYTPSEDGSISGLTVVEGELSIHFMTLGNKYAGDCIYIKAGEVDILIDAGSRSNSVPTIKEYLDGYVVDGSLEYVIATHADQDHIAGFSGKTNIFSEYVCKTIIDFPLTDKTTATYNNYVANRDAEVLEGATHYTALQCYNNLDGAKREYQLTDNISFEILYNYYYENRHEDENNYSVCVNFKHGDRNFLFTGDLEEDGEYKLVQLNDIKESVFFKAGHHGSKTSSNDVLLQKVKPKLCVVPCVVGTPEYTDTVANQFPTQAFIDRISVYTDRVFAPSQVEFLDDESYSYKDLNGNIMIKSYSDKVEVACSVDATFLKDTEWFKANRICPNGWLPSVA